MAGCIGDRDRSSVRDPEKGEPLQAGRVANSLEIADPRVQRELPDVTIRQPAAALVVANDGIGPSELVQPMAPNRAVPIELEMREPRRRPDDGFTVPVLRERDPYPVGGRAEADALVHSPRQ